MCAYAVAWIIDQVCFTVTALVILILFGLQYIRLRSRVSGQDPPIVRFLCKIGICVGALQLLRALDPAGVNGWYPAPFTGLISNEVGCFLFTGFAYLNYLTLTFNYRLSSSLDPPPKLLKISFIAIVSLQWLIGNIVSIVLWVVGSELIGYAVILFWVGCIAMPLSLLTLDVSIYLLKKLLYQSAAERAQMVLNREGSYGSLNPDPQNLQSSSDSYLPRTFSGSRNQIPSTTQALSSSSSSSSALGTPAPTSALNGGGVGVSDIKEDQTLNDSSKGNSYSPLPSSPLSSGTNLLTTTIQTSNTSDSITPLPPSSHPKIIRRPSISSSISISASIPPSTSTTTTTINRPLSPPEKSKSRSGSFFSNYRKKSQPLPPQPKPELTVTKNKALKKLITLQIFSHIIGIVIIGLSIAYIAISIHGSQIRIPVPDQYSFWWTIFSHTENAFALVMLWYVWRPITYLICPKRGRLINRNAPFTRPGFINPSNNINTPFMPRDPLETARA